MGRFLSTLVTLLWGLWFGGVMTLFLAVSTLFFVAFPDRHDLAGQGAAPIFRMFNRYQLTLAAAALIATFCWYLAGPPRLKMGLFLLLAVATTVAGIVTLYIAPQIAHLQAQHLTQSAEFSRMHGYSMMAYLIEAVCLGVAGLFLPWMRDNR